MVIERSKENNSNIIDGGSRMGHLGQMPPPPPPPPCGGAILLFKILDFVKPRSVYKIHENMYILLQIHLKPKLSNQSDRTKVKLTMKLSPSTFMHTKRL